MEPCGFDSKYLNPRKGSEECSGLGLLGGWVAHYLECRISFGKATPVNPKSCQHGALMIELISPYHIWFCIWWNHNVILCNALHITLLYGCWGSSLFNYYLWNLVPKPKHTENALSRQSHTYSLLVMSTLIFSVLVLHCHSKSQWIIT